MHNIVTVQVRLRLFAVSSRFSLSTYKTLLHYCSEKWSSNSDWVHGRTRRLIWLFVFLIYVKDYFCLLQARQTAVCANCNDSDQPTQSANQEGHIVKTWADRADIKDYLSFRGLQMSHLLSRNVRKHTVWYVRPTKTQISLHFRTV